MCHLPEHAYDLKNVLYNKTQHVPKFFGYAHWFDFKEVVNWPMDSFNKSMIGLLEYDKCYINTQHQKEMVLKQAEEIFNSDTLYKLSNILQVQHIGVDSKDIVLDINEKEGKKTIKLIKKNGGKGIFLKTNVSKSNQVIKSINHIIKIFGEINILFFTPATKAGIEFISTEEG